MPVVEVSVHDVRLSHDLNASFNNAVIWEFVELQQIGIQGKSFIYVQRKVDIAQIWYALLVGKKSYKVYVGILQVLAHSFKIYMWYMQNGRSPPALA